MWHKESEQQNCDLRTYDTCTLGHSKLTMEENTVSPLLTISIRGKAN